MIMNSFGRYGVETAHDHEIPRCCAAAPRWPPRRAAPSRAGTPSTIRCPVRPGRDRPGRPARLMTIDRAAPGDQLILTKALGTGVVATALKHGRRPRAW